MVAGKPNDIFIYLVFCPIYIGQLESNVSFLIVTGPRKSAKNDDQKRYSMTILSMTMATPLGG
jgi:hypothetical protein